MTRVENAKRATELRAQGLTYREIGEQMGVSLKTVHAWVSDPDGAKLRARKESYRGKCEACGNPTDGSNGPAKAARHCKACSGTISASRSRTDWAGYRRIVEEMWADGMTTQQIADALGWKSKHTLCVCRYRGYNLPHRRSPEQVARIAAGWAEARARKEMA